MKLKKLRTVFASAVMLAIMLGSATDLTAAKSFIYIGTYTQGSDSEGIYLFGFDDESGALSPAGIAGISINPSFLALHPTKNLLFAVGETSDFLGAESGSVAGFQIDPETGKLAEINRVPSGGTSPCHLVVDHSGRHLLVANYHGGSVAAVRIGDDGKLGQRTAFCQHQGSGPLKPRQAGPHAHSIKLDLAGERAFAADLGIDQLAVYDYQQEAGTLRQLSAEKIAPASGPRHLAIHPGGKFLYLLNEISSTLTVIGYAPDSGATRQLQTISTLPPGYQKYTSTAEVQITPDGRFLYASNRGHDSLACYRVDAASGKLTLIEIEASGGRTPRNFGIHPGGKFLIAANQNSNTLKVFAIDPQTGALEPTAHGAVCPRPVCVTFFNR